MLFSVVIPSRNRIDLLRRAIASVDKAKLEANADVEIIVVDNASTKPIESENLRSSCPLRIVRNPSSYIVARNRNLGVDHANGELICFLDDDDEYLPAKFKDIMAWMPDGDAAFAYGNTEQVGPGGQFIGLSGGQCDIRNFLRWRYIHCNALVVRADVFRTLRFNEAMGTYEDVEFVGRLIRSFKGQHIDRSHAIWYRDNRPDQLTKRNLPRSKQSLAILCDTFSQEIHDYPELSKFYLNKMILLCLTQIDLLGSMKYASARWLGAQLR